MDYKPVKNSKNVRFDEEMKDIDIRNTNTRQLRIALGRPLREDHKYAPIIMTPTFDFQQTSFTMIYDVPAKVLCDNTTLLTILVYLPNRDRIYLKIYHSNNILFQNKGLGK